MEGSRQNSNQFYGQMNLSPGQQDLLMAALNSNNPNAQNFYSSAQDGKPVAENNQEPTLENLDPSFYLSTQQSVPGSNLNSLNMNTSPFGEFLDGDTSFDFDAPDGELMVDGLPDDSPEAEEETELGDKRKNPGEDNEDAEGGSKRREGEDKTAKKPGRKPLTSEPTTKRKAQNRAAQRAFRERKEKHLKDLETKVSDLEKASDATNHENGLLRAQVARLQVELREYRKRMSLNSSTANRSPPLNGNHTQPNGNAAVNSFQFEFPRFGGLPGAQMFKDGPLAKNSSTVSTNTATMSSMPSAAGVRQNSADNSISPRNQQSPLVASPENMGILSPVNGLANVQQPAFNGTTPTSERDAQLSPTGVHRNSKSRHSSEQTSKSSSGAYGRSSLDASGGQWRPAPYTNGFTSSTSNSPSASSASHFGANTSADTSPEPSHNSPAKSGESNMDTIKEGYVCHGNSEGESAFCENLNTACGNPRNPIPKALNLSNDNTAAASTQSPLASANSNGAPTPATSNNPITPALDNVGLDFLANQNGGQFDPLLFGDYRDSQAAIVGDGDFTNGFFNDAFAIQDFGSPFHFGDTPAVQKPNPLEQIEKLQDGVEEEEVVPGEDRNQMMNCHKIWDKLSTRQDFQEGTFDIDGLCSELRAKARCSESGVVVDRKDVDAAFARTREPQK